MYYTRAIYIYSSIIVKLYKFQMSIGKRVETREVTRLKI